MLKLASALTLAALIATPAVAQQHTKQTTITSTTTKSEPMPPRPAKQAPVEVAPLPPDPNAGPAPQPQALGELKETVTTPGTVTTSGEIVKYKLPDWQVKSGSSGSSESTEIHLGVP